MLQQTKNFFRQNYLLLLILLLAIVLRILYFSPSISFPGSNVVLEAMHLKEGLYNPNLIWHPVGIRYVLVALVSLSISLFGLSEFSVYFPIFLASLANVIIIYFLAKEMFDEKVGLLSAFLLAILPLDVINATVLEADILMNTFMLSGILLYYCLRKYEKNVLYFIIVGALFSLGMFVKIFVLLILPVLFLHEIVSGFNFKRLLFIGLGFVIIAVPIFLYQYAETGDFLYNIHVEKGHVYAITQIKENFEPIHQFVPEENDYLEYPRLLFSVLPEKLWNTRHTDGGDPMINIYIYIFVIGLFVFHKKIERNKLILLLLWGIFMFSFLEFYVIIQKVQRYLLIALYPIIILCAALIIEKLTTKARVMITFITIIFLVSIVQLGFITVLDKETSTTYGGTERFIAYSLNSLPPKGFPQNKLSIF